MMRSVVIALMADACMIMAAPTPTATRDPDWGVQFTDSSIQDWGQVVGPWRQCGGSNYIGLTQCVSGWICVALNDTESRCLPPWGDQATIPGTVAPPNQGNDNAMIASKPPPTGMNGLVPGWEQCGGREFNYSRYGEQVLAQATMVSFGSSTPELRLPCVSGYACNRFTEWYFQCVPTAIAGFWAQCAGDASYTGPSQCADGSECQYVDAKYSLCVPKLF